MAHLIDANCFIQAKNSYYGFDFCPGYWQWIDDQNQLGVVFSLDKIADELTGMQDELSHWAKQKSSSFFLPIDAPTLVSYQQIVTWANGASFTPQAIPEFLRGADPFLVAYALAHGHTVVSHERLLNPNQRNKIKIPAVCQQFGVPYITVFDLIKSTGAKFELRE